MPVQPQLFPDSSTGASRPDQHASHQATPIEVNPPAPAVQPAPIWLQRMSLFVLVVFCIYLGVIVTVLPWWLSVWDHNLFFLSHPRLWAILRLGPTRGIISGLGLLDIWVGISEAIHYHDQRS
jgi:hypothetical protein